MSKLLNPRSSTGPDSGGVGVGTDIDLEEALGYIFGCFREDFGPLKFLFSSLSHPTPHEIAGVGIKEGK